jgi:hypothetical protein
VSSKWKIRLTELLEEHNASHNTTTTLREALEGVVFSRSEKSESSQNRTAKTAKTPERLEAISFEKTEKLETPQNSTAKTAKTENCCGTEDKNPRARLGLIATWSAEFGYVSIHDPVSGAWHDLPTQEAPSWAGWEARKRKELYQGGNRKAYRLSASEMEEIWKAEHVSKHEGILEDYPPEEE